MFNYNMPLDTPGQCLTSRWAYIHGLWDSHNTREAMRTGPVRFTRERWEELVANKQIRELDIAPLCRMLGLSRDELEWIYAGRPNLDAFSASRRDTKWRLLLGRRVRAAREAQRLSQVEAAARCNLAQSYWSKVERGRTVPEFKNLCRIASALNTDWSALAAGPLMALYDVPERDADLEAFADSLF